MTMIPTNIGHSDNLKWLWFLPMLGSMYTIYYNLYYIYSYTLTDSMSVKMYMEGKINYITLLANTAQATMEI